MLDGENAKVVSQRRYKKHPWRDIVKVDVIKAEKAKRKK